MDAKTRELVRVSLLLLAEQTSRRFGCTLESFASSIELRGLGATERDVERELEHLQDAGLLEELPGDMVTECRRWTWTAKGRAWMARQGY